MAAYDRAALGAVLKDVYDDKIVDLIESESWFLSTLEKADPREFPGGELLKWLVKVSPNTSYAIGNMDGGELPDPGRRNQVRASVDVVDHSGSCGLTQDSIDRALGGEASFYRVISECKDEITEDLREVVNAQLYKQQIWQVATDATNATTIVLDGVQYIRVGDVLTFGNRTNGTGASTRVVASKDIDDSTVTLTAPITVTAAASGAWYAGAGPGDAVVMESLDKIATETRVLHGIDSATYPQWGGNTIDLEGAAPDEGDVRKLINRSWERGRDVIEYALTTIGIQDRIAAGMVSQKRFTNGDSVRLRGGFTGLMVGAAGKEVAVVAERDVPKGRLYTYGKKSMRLYKGPAGFVQLPDSNGIFRYIRNANGRATSTFAATYRMKLNLLADRPAGTGRLINCEDDDPVYAG